MTKSPIEWTDVTWNPVRGCSRVSEGCRKCYAERVAARFSKDDLSNNNAGDQPFYGFAIQTESGPRWTGKVELIESKLEEPLHWKKPRRVFVNSMSDLFHESLPDWAIDRVFAVMALCPRHSFQVLTKRAERMLAYFAPGKFRDCLVASAASAFSTSVSPFALPSEAIFDARRVARGEKWQINAWPLPNVWLGVSVEDQATADERIPLLLQTPAAVRFVSYEPALGPVNLTPYLGHRTYRCKCGWHETQLDLTPEGRDWRCLKCFSTCQEFPALDWLICGGESGPCARPFDLAWARSARDQCKAANVPFFLKQLGAAPIIHRRDEWPVQARPGQFQIFSMNEPQIYPRQIVHLRDKKGGNPSEWPLDLQGCREFPEVRR
jgi:protein gp37